MRGIDCNAVACIFDDSIAEDRVLEIGPAGRAFGFAAFGMRGTAPNQQDTEETRVAGAEPGHSHSSSL